MPGPAINNPVEKFWSLTQEDAFAGVVSSDKGLSESESAARLKKYGANTFKSQSRSSSVILFLLQFKSPITILLIAAVLLSMGLGDFSDAFIILFIIMVSSRQCSSRTAENGPDKVYHYKR